MTIIAEHVLEAVDDAVEYATWRRCEREAVEGIGLYVDIWSAWIGKFNEHTGVATNIEQVIASMFSKGPNDNS